MRDKTTRRKSKMKVARWRWAENRKRANKIGLKLNRRYINTRTERWFIVNRAEYEAMAVENRMKNGAKRSSSSSSDEHISHVFLSALTIDNVGSFTRSSPFCQKFIDSTGARIAVCCSLIRVKAKGRITIRLGTLHRRSEERVQRCTLMFDSV